MSIFLMAVDLRYSLETITLSTFINTRLSKYLRRAIPLVWNKNMKLAPSPICNCGPEDQTAEHIPQRCPLLQTARTNVWPTAVQLHTKLYGSKEEVEKTATVIFQTGLAV